MRLINISEDQFNQKTAHLPCLNWYETKEWAKLKSHTGWHSHFLLYINDNDEVTAGVMLLDKNIPMSKKKLFYAPRGPLIDFDNLELLKAFHNDLIKYIKTNDGFELLIDPYLEYQHRDMNGDIINDGFSRQDVVDTLIKLGYHHNNGFNLYNENLQPRWLYRLSLKGRTFDEIFKKFKAENRRLYKKKDFYAITVRELKRNEINKYKDVMAHTASRRGFIDRPLKYYEDMYDAMHESRMLRYFVAEINFEKAISNFNEDINKSLAKLERLRSRSNQNTKTQNEIREEEIRYNSLLKNLEIIKGYAAKSDNITVLSGITLLNYGNEAVMLLAGNYEDYELFSSSVILVSELIKISVEEGQDYYNFYGITGDFDESNPLNGLYTFKKGFGGEVMELIGEFEYVIDPLSKSFYEMGLKVYNLLKKIRH